MFNFLKLAAQIALTHYHLTDKESYRKFLLDLLSSVPPLAQKFGVQLDDSLLRHLAFLLNSDALFGYIYTLIRNQLRTEEILFESANEETIRKLCESTAQADTEHPQALGVQTLGVQAINPVVIVSLVSQILSIINAMKK